MEKNALHVKTKVQLIEMHEIDREITGNYLVHLSKEEWNKISNSLPDAVDNGKLPEDGLLVIPFDRTVPDLGFIVFPMRCPNPGVDCVRLYSPEYSFGDCGCPPSPGGDLPGGSTIPHCTIKRNPKTGLIECSGLACRAGCRPEKAAIKIGKIIMGYRVFCNCN